MGTPKSRISFISRHWFGVDDLFDLAGVETRSTRQENLPRFFRVFQRRQVMVNDSVHIGQLIKSVFDESGMTVSELARQLHCERTNVYTIFKRRTVDVELLAMLSEILNHNFLDDAMQLYGLTATFSPKLNFTIYLDDFTAKQIEHLVEVLNEFKTEV